MLRVSVAGTSCSGKTTLARKIAEANGIPHVELDAIYWRADWNPLPVEEFRRAVEVQVAADEWVVDGNYSLMPITMLHTFVEQQTLPDDYHRGYKVVLDKDGITSQLPQPGYKAVSKRKPSEEEFLYAVNVFWFELFHLVKYLHRQDLWHVKLRDASIKKRLLQMIEWHAQASHNWDYDTWLVGKYMQSWVEPELWRAFFEIFAHFDKEDSWRAVCALMPLYRRLAGETARQLNYAYPYEMDKAISEFILGNRPV